MREEGRDFLLLRRKGFLHCISINCLPFAVLLLLRCFGLFIYMGLYDSKKEGRAENVNVSLLALTLALRMTIVVQIIR